MNTSCQWILKAANISLTCPWEFINTCHLFSWYKQCELRSGNNTGCIGKLIVLASWLLQRRMHKFTHLSDFVHTNNSVYWGFHQKSSFLPLMVETV